MVTVFSTIFARLEAILDVQQESEYASEHHFLTKSNVVKKTEINDVRTLFLFTQQQDFASRLRKTSVNNLS